MIVTESAGDDGEVDIDGDEQQRHRAQQRLTILSAVDEALRRHTEILPLLWASANREEGLAAVRTLLAVDTTCAQAVLDLQWSRLARDERATVADECARLVAVLGRAPGQ